MQLALVWYFPRTLSCLTDIAKRSEHFSHKVFEFISSPISTSCFLYKSAKLFLFLLPWFSSSLLPKGSRVKYSWSKIPKNLVIYWTRTMQHQCSTIICTTNSDQCTTIKINSSINIVAKHIPSTYLHHLCTLRTAIWHQNFTCLLTMPSMRLKG